MRRSVLLLSLLVLLLLGGCYQQRYLAGFQPPRAGGKRPQPITQKIVVDKQKERYTVLAHDGTWCSVGATRYQRIRVGDAVWCAWQD